MIQNHRYNWTALSETGQADIEAMEEADRSWEQNLVSRLLDQLRLLDERGESCAMPISRLEHCLQTATRALNDGRDDDYVACALLHDIGDVLAPHNHAAIAADVVKPFVSERNHWIVLNHSIFQGYYFFQHLGLDPNAREAFRDHPYFDYTAEFCEKYDQCAFDPAYSSLPLEHFVPILQRVFNRPRAASDGDGMTTAEIKTLLQAVQAG